MRVMFCESTAEEVGEHERCRGKHCSCEKRAFRVKSFTISVLFCMHGLFSFREPVQSLKQASSVGQGLVMLSKQYRPLPSSLQTPANPESCFWYHCSHCGADVLAAVARPGLPRFLARHGILKRELAFSSLFHDDCAFHTSVI